MSPPSGGQRARALLVAAGLCGALAAPAAAAPATVTVANDQFSPSAVSVGAGESVTWNFAEASHNVKGSGWSGNDDFGKGGFTKAFAAAGTFSFLCEAHPAKMKGTVTVTAAAAPSATPTLPGVIADVVGALPGIGWLFPATEDVRAPALESMRVSVPRSTRRPRVSVRLSEPALIVVRARRVGSPAAVPTTRKQGSKGLNRFALKPRSLRAGRYRLRVGAVDEAGNESPVRTTTIRVRAAGR